ncbi:hypothetical protein [Mucilaginibacter sp. L3T2-6]|uniref:hypothetical protein n=1 Tax=Mucilaginibacter sp. L3T2-6 TaxID=3062491 RepID=UPI0026758EBF|nr:hypothetical protein [Mucilaginibacter sp. L3T2-6]MDO3641278.1 hypothetical protein [Mucilaginibacter sp. L3T2-6]MDV6213962.1 hypothetical protein [Mucilaginibacter sp. L3T2-6]
MNKTIHFILALLVCSVCSAQQYQSLLDQSFIVHSAGNIFVNSNSNSRNIIQLDLPEKTSALVYRITTGAAATSSPPEKLFQLLKNVLPGQLSMEASLAQFVISNTDGKSIDHFIFSNVFDANAFLGKQDHSWTFCKQNSGIMSICQATQSCISPTIYFGFRNNNLATPVSVHLEVVAVIDTSKQANSVYSYNIANGTAQSVKYLISNDRVNWEELSLQPGYAHTLKRNQSKILIRLVTGISTVVTYEIHPEDRYKIVWNAGRWDLNKY